MLEGRELKGVSQNIGRIEMGGARIVLELVVVNRDILFRVLQMNCRLGTHDADMVTVAVNNNKEFVLLQMQRERAEGVVGWRGQRILRFTDNIDELGFKLTMRVVGGCIPVDFARVGARRGIVDLGNGLGGIGRVEMAAGELGSRGEERAAGDLGRRKRRAGSIGRIGYRRILVRYSFLSRGVGSGGDVFRFCIGGGNDLLDGRITLEYSRGVLEKIPC